MLRDKYFFINCNAQKSTLRHLQIIKIWEHNIDADNKNVAENIGLLGTIFAPPNDVCNVEFVEKVLIDRELQYTLCVPQCNILLMDSEPQATGNQGPCNQSKVKWKLNPLNISIKLVVTKLR